MWGRAIGFQGFWQLASRIKFVFILLIFNFLKRKKQMSKK